jgi:hypothetical protein
MSREDTIQLIESSAKKANAFDELVQFQGIVLEYIPTP